MDKYMNRKLDAYGQPLKFLKTYKIMTIIILALLGIGIVFDLFKIPSWNLSFSILNLGIPITVVAIVAGVLSLFSLPLLDKFAFFTTLSFVTVFILRALGAVLVLPFNSFSAQTDVIMNSGDVLSNGVVMVDNVLLSMLTTIEWVSCGFLVILSVPLIWCAIQVIKHRQLFFTELEQLETEYVEEDTQAEEVQEAVAQ